MKDEKEQKPLSSINVLLSKKKKKEIKGKKRGRGDGREVIGVVVDDENGSPIVESLAHYISSCTRKETQIRRAHEMCCPSPAKRGSSSLSNWCGILLGFRPHCVS
jgi:hypothetical protein